MRLLPAIAVACLLATARALAQDNAECLECHNDPEFTATRDGKTVSMFLDEAKLKAAVDLLLEKHPREAVAVYLNAFNDMNEAHWENLKTMLESDARLQLGDSPPAAAPA